VFPTLHGEYDFAPIGNLKKNVNVLTVNYEQSSNSFDSKIMDKVVTVLILKLWTK
jgi:hypothetical protein